MESNLTKKVYLAGPIKGLDYNNSIAWRDHVIRELEKSKIIGASPMRAKEFLKNEKNLSENYENPLAKIE